MIGAINIIHKPSGLSIYNKTFGDLLKINENLFSGFITALQLLIDEISHKTIDEVKLGEHSLLLAEDEVLTISILVDELESTVNMRKKIKTMFNKIYERFPKDKLAKWNGNMNAVKFIDELTKDIFNSYEGTSRVHFILEKLKKITEMTDITYYGILTRDGELIYSSTDNKKINALVLKAFDSLEKHVSLIKAANIDNLQEKSLQELVSTKVGTIVFSNVNNHYKIFVINNDDEKLGWSLMSVEKIIEKINYSLNLEKMKIDQNTHLKTDVVEI